MYSSHKDWYVIAAKAAHVIHSGLITCNAFSVDYTPQRIADYILPTADYMRGFAVIGNGSEKLAKNYLLEYSEELVVKCVALCKTIPQGNSNTVFQLRKSSSSVFANITEVQYSQSLPNML